VFINEIISKIYKDVKTNDNLYLVKFIIFVV